MAGKSSAEHRPGKAGTVDTAGIGRDAVEYAEVAAEGGEIPRLEARFKDVGQCGEFPEGLSGGGGGSKRGGCLADGTAAGAMFEAGEDVAVPDEADADFVAAQRVVGRSVGSIHRHLGGPGRMAGEGYEAVIVEGAHGANISRAARTPSTSAATSSNVL